MCGRARSSRGAVESGTQRCPRAAVLASFRDDGPVGRRAWWSGWSWRARVGWILLGWALLVVCVALPVWALAAGDLTEVAGWANILALPVTALGVLLVFADRDRARAADPSGRRRPWMALLLLAE